MRCEQYWKKRQELNAQKSCNPLRLERALGGLNRAATGLVWIDRVHVGQQRNFRSTAAALSLGKANMQLDDLRQDIHFWAICVLDG